MYGIDDIKNCVFVDLQGFKDGHEYVDYICKEFCLIDGDFVYNVIVRSPFPINEMSSKYYQRRAKLTTEKQHKISYDCGDIDLADLKREVFPRLQNKTIIVKGWVKSWWLHQLFGREINCVNIDRFKDFKSFDQQQQHHFEVCDYHNTRFPSTKELCTKCSNFTTVVHCSKYVALKMRDFILKKM